MNTNQLIELLKKDKFAKKQFCGVIPLDFLPIKKIKKPCCFIVNTDKSTKPGEHWVAIYVPKLGKIEYFDSYGLKPQNKEILLFLNINSNSYKFNSKIIQGVNSVNCGLYCLFYLYFKTRNYKMSKYLKFFTSNKEHNDLFINSLYNKIK